MAQAVSAAARMRLTTSGIKTQQKHTYATTSSTTEEFMQKVGSTYHSSNLLPPLIKIGGISSSSHAFKAR